MLMVKPGLPYLDVLSKISSQFNIPVFSYQVSGEYASLKAAALQGWIDFDQVLMETLLCFKRAGARGVFTYAALEGAKLLKG
jgi:porphobilinogen synthase